MTPDTMTAGTPRKRLWRSIGAVAAGFAAIFVLSAVTDAILEGTGVFPTPAQQQERGFTALWMQLLALGYRFTYTVAGAALTAWLAPHSPWRHVLALAIVGTAVGIAASVAVASMQIFPLWFSVALVLIGLPAMWLGGRLAIVFIEQQRQPR